MTTNRLRVADEVRHALASGTPVVALESTLISHGLPTPLNLETAHRLEATVRASGAVPATVGVIDGRVTIGLDGDELALLATAPGVRKCSRRDLPAAIAGGAHGATTVAATLALMARAGVRVLATGGIGGVHRGAETTFDVSADLAELARTPAVVVCAGAKALLDLPRTVELLETLSVPVLGWQTDELPAFYTRGSGLPVSQRVADAVEVARIADTAWQLDLCRGLLLAVPPPEDAALAAADAERALDEALGEADRRGIRGAAITPFLLDAVARATDGRSLAANVALLEQNARIGAAVALALARMDR